MIYNNTESSNTEIEIEENLVRIDSWGEENQIYNVI